MDDRSTQVVTGGPSQLDPTQQACFYPPTILTGVQQDWDIIQEEVFGPVVTVQVSLCRSVIMSVSFI